MDMSTILTIMLTGFVCYVAGVITTAYSMAKGFSQGVDEVMNGHTNE